ncbi:hypothetical protein [Microvirga makkahensis]|uniref:Uncharacterized protein n=1 Tax=Microvirga makkahensis TaxID=1128670 RepID=A0A7X3MW22_9HYPH|nr:hypothetical protein [Microvirga makkahensis]MXQ14098.1 hypothetical protein [Microvirga makkahensis]
MTEEEIEVVAEELAKIGGTAWYPGRQHGPILRAVTERYREQARVVIAALERMRAGSEAVAVPGPAVAENRNVAKSSQSDATQDIRPGLTVIYRPAGDQRAYPCRVVEISGSQAYLAPIMRTCIGWISIETILVPPEDETSGKE